jgi:hypothetical protein
LRCRGLGLGHFLERVFLGVGFLHLRLLGLLGRGVRHAGLAGPVLRLLLVGVVAVAGMALGSGEGARSCTLLATLVCRGLTRSLGVLAAATAA